LDTVISKPTRGAGAATAGTSNSDGITRSGALNLNNIDSDAQLQYSTDGQTWTSSFTAVEGTNSVTLKVTDAAGNVATSDTLSFTLNAADAVFTAQLDLSSNSGSSTDLLTQDLTPTISGTGTEGDIIQVTMPGTGEILSTTVAADGKWSVTASTDVASGTVSVTASNAAGVVSAAKTLTLQIDASITTPVISLISDTGSNSTDKVTSNGTFTVSADSDSLLTYSTNGTTWSSTFTAAEGANTVQVRATDAAGNVATSSAFSFTLDSQTSVFTVALSCDSGTASDKLSRDATLVITGAEAGADISYSTNGSTWTSTYTAAEGLNTVKVRVMDAAGNQRTQDYSFTLDSTAPTPAALTLVCDSGSQGADKLTNNGNINVAAEAGATLEYSTNGTTWGTTFVASEGANTVSVRVTDQAGNVSNTSSLSFTLDSAAPTAPTVGLVCDSGSISGAGTDKITNTGTLSLSSVEAGGQLEYSTNGVNWATTFAAAEGVNNVKVRVTDATGNTGAVATYSFTLDTQAPAAPVLGLVCDSGALGTDKITQTGNLTASSLEAGATLQYS
ncbi:Ig-like domain-containing protein, partial [Limnohabitans planktonicus]